MKRVLVLVFCIFLFLGCTVPVTYYDYSASVFVTNNTASNVDVTVEGVTKTLYGLSDWADWEIEWSGTESQDTKEITIRIPTDTLNYEIEAFEVAEFYVN